MITITASCCVNASTDSVFELFLDHEHLTRFFTAKIRIVKLGNGSLSNGIGCHRRVSLFGFSFTEQIENITANTINYRVINSKIIQNHRGVIGIERTKMGTDINYLINFQLPWWLPNRLIAKAIRQDLHRALNNIEVYFNAS